MFTFSSHSITRGSLSIVLDAGICLLRVPMCSLASNWRESGSSILTAIVPLVWIRLRKRGSTVISGHLFETGLQTSSCICLSLFSRAGVSLQTSKTIYPNPALLLSPYVSSEPRRHVSWLKVKQKIQTLLIAL